MLCVEGARYRTRYDVGERKMGDREIPCDNVRKKIILWMCKVFVEIILLKVLQLGVYAPDAMVAAQ